MIKKIKNASSGMLDTGLKTIDSTTTKVIGQADAYIQPVRTSIFKRFPILFSLAVTLGASMTFLGFEKLVSCITLLDNNPILMLILGIGILALTGTLYKKLS